MENRHKFVVKYSFRLFEDEFEQCEKAVRHAKTPEGWRKYDSISHLIRSAIMQLLDREKFEVKPGRPKKYDNGRGE